MPDVTPSSTATPSRRGSAPADDLLKSIPVRDRRQASRGTHQRRMSDFESHASVSRTLAVLGLAALLGGGFWSLFTRMVEDAWKAPPAALPIAETAVVRHATPAKSRPLPPASQAPLADKPDTPLMDEPLPEPAAPENLRADFLGPRTLEIQWDKLPNGTHYRAYWAGTPTLENAQPITEQPVQGTHMMWNFDTGLRDIWIAIKGIDAAGRETPFSPPLHVKLPS